MHNILSLKRHNITNAVASSHKRVVYLIETDNYITEFRWASIYSKWIICIRNKREHARWWEHYDSCSPLELLLVFNIVLSDISSLLEFTLWVKENEGINCPLERAIAVTKAIKDINNVT